jgi:hypothetical protein
MNPSLQLNIPPMHVPRAEHGAKTAKAALRKPENVHADMASVVALARKLSHLNLDEFAHHCGKDPRQIARWESGTERPQIEAVWAVAELRPFVLEAMAALASCRVETETVIRIKRTA